jgi:hypothetical protein
VENFIKKDFNLHTQDADECTALHLAAMKGHTYILMLLTEAASIELLTAVSKRGQTALDCARDFDHNDAVEVLNNKLQQEEETLKMYDEQAEEKACEYAMIKKDEPLSKDEYKDVVYNILVHMPALPAKNDKYVATDLTLAEFQHAAKGLYEILQVSEGEIFYRLSKGVQAIREEVKELGDKVVIQQLHYILCKSANEKKFPNGIRDKGHKGMTLKDFVNHENARATKLTEAEVVALRLYTTPAFKEINNPLRDVARIKSGRPHPLAVTVTLITSGIKKLRALNAESAAATQSKMLWRGLKQRRQTDDFALKGGTEVCVCVCV